MSRILSLYGAINCWLTVFFPPCLLPLAARFSFAAVLAGYYWHSALTKFSDGLFGFLRPTTGAYYQILPTITEAVGYDTEQIGGLYTAIVMLGSWAEVVLPLLIIVGLFTRLSALGMIGFIIVQSLTDIFGHGVDAVTIGSWFDRHSSSLIMDQRLFWVVILLILLVKGGGKLSLDSWLKIGSKDAK